MTSIEQDFWLELAQIQAESIGWIPLDDGVYLHVGSDVTVIQVVGIAKVEMAGSNVLWLTQKPKLSPLVWQSNSKPTDVPSRLPTQPVKSTLLLTQLGCG